MERSSFRLLVSGPPNSDSGKTRFAPPRDFEFESFGVVSAIFGGFCGVCDTSAVFTFSGD